MKTSLAVLGVLLVVAPALAEPQVEAGDPLGPCAEGKTNGAEAEPSQDSWGVQIASSFSKQATLDEFAKIKDQYSDILGDYSPTIVEVCDLSMGTDVRYAARIAMEDRAAADKLCQKLQAAGGACIVLKN